MEKTCTAYSEQYRLCGHLVQSFCVCSRQAWFASRGFSVDQLNDGLRVGRSISSESYSREHRGIVIGNDVVDVACERGEILVIGEVKKSSRCREAARMQLAHYLLQLRKKGIDAVGELRFYGERRKESLVLNPETEKELETIYRGIDEICSHGSPPPLSWKKVCGSCSYRDFCWG